MELLSLVKEVLQSIAERAVSYRLGQSALRYMDRALWIIEKSARWAVPPPLDQDERPQQELIRPLPWVFFFALLITLRITRECISLANLALGKPPLRSADVVTYIQGKRRYLRTLKYQGNRMMRARTEQVTRESWYSQLQSMFEFTMCFRRQPYGNNNTQLINGDEVLVVKRNKKPRQEASTVASTSETSMERLIEKMLVDVDVDSDESSSYTLTNLTSGRSDKSDYNTESDQETNTKTQVQQSQDNETVKQTQVKQSQDDETVKQTQVNQSQDRETVKQTQDKESQDDETVKQTQDKESQDDETLKPTQDKQTQDAAEVKQTHYKQSQDDETVKQSQDNETVKQTHDNQSQDDETIKQTQGKTKQTKVKQSQNNETVKETQDMTSLATFNTKTQENNIKTSTPKKKNKGKLIDFDQSKNSMTRLARDNDMKQERDTDTKEATIDFMQNEIGSRRNDADYGQYKIVNGGMPQDLTATER